MYSAKPSIKNRSEQKGLREYLLCEDCEQKISVWENYAKYVLEGGSKKVQLDADTSGNLVTVSGIDYKQFKLFQLSILWRASVSSQVFFSKVSLGKYEERLRTMLFNDDAGECREFGCIMFGLKEDKAVTDIIEQPFMKHIDNGITQRFIFSGFLWSFMVSEHLSKKYEIAFLQPSGKLTFLVRKLSEMKSMFQFAKELEKLGRLR